MVLAAKVAAAPVRRAARSDKLHVIPFRVPYHTEIETSVPACNSARYLRALHAAMDMFGYTSGFILELRYVAPDDIPLSPDYHTLHREWPFQRSADALHSASTPGVDAPDELDGLLGECRDGSCRTCGAGAELQDVPRLHVTAGLYFPSDEQFRGFFSAAERLAMLLGGRSHWAKNLFATPDALRAAYPHFDDFRAIRQRFDPENVFFNAFLKRALGS
jgi:FAD/FMN-containing dehydrogenase